MRLAVIGMNFFNYTTSLVSALRRLGHQVLVLSCEDPVYGRSWLAKRFSKIGLAEKSESIRKRCYAAQCDLFINDLIDFKADAAIFLNGDFVDSEHFNKIKLNVPLVMLYLLDGIKRSQRFEQMAIGSDIVVCADADDAQVLQERFSHTVIFRPIFGYEQDIFYPSSDSADGEEKILDIVFVGNPTKNRLLTLCAVADYAEREKLRFAVYGNDYWRAGLFWKKYAFKRKYGALCKYVHNSSVKPEEAALLYRKAKICLNIHIDAHDILNNRTFEALGTGSFVLCDDKKQLHDCFMVGEELEIYKSEKELLRKIAYYLSNDSERNSIAANGYNLVHRNYSIKNTAEQLCLLLQKELSNK